MAADTRDSTFQRLAYVAMAVAAASAVVFAELPESTRFMHVLHKTGHPIGFAVISFCLMQLMSRESPLAQSRWKLCASAFVLSVGIGVATEAAQLFTHRGASIVDVASDALGAVLGIALFLFFNSPRRQRSLVAALLAGLLALGPLLWCLAAYIHRDTKFPLLADAESRLFRYFMSAGENAPKIVTLPGGEGIAAFRVGVGRGYGLQIEEAFPDWKGYQRFCVELANHGVHDLNLIVRIHDRQHNWESEDRLNLPVILEANSRQVVRIPLQLIEDAPAGRPMNLRRIENVAVFATRPQSEGEFYVVRIWLE